MLNIKNEETYRLARELADIEETTLTQAVTDALRARLLAHDHERARRRQVMTALIDSARGHRAPDAPSSAAEFDDLYDPQTGLPK